MANPLPPQAVACRKLLFAVADLHVRGYQRLRAVPYIGGPGAWRCVIAPVQLISQRHGAWLSESADEFELPHYSGAQDRTYWGWHDRYNASPRRLARVFLDRFPRIAQQGYGPDWAYAGWFLHMLHLTYPDDLPISCHDRLDALIMYGREEHIPMPPPGEDEAVDGPSTGSSTC